MNKTMIAMAAALLVGLAPVPTTSGAELNDCIEPTVDKVEQAADNAGERVKALLAPSTSAANAQLACVGEVECEAVVNSLAADSDLEGLCKPRLESCAAGEVGRVVGGVPACVTVPDPTVEACPEGQVGLATKQDAWCFSQQVKPDAPGIGMDGPKDPNCAKAEDDPGTGGTHVSCNYACWEFDELGIGVTAMDKDAGTYGGTSCGGQDAICNEPVPACVGISPGLTSRREQNQPCNGHSDEFNSSPTTVYCVSVGRGTAQNALCKLEDIFCDLDPSATSTVGLGTPLADACATALGTSVFATLQGIIEGIPADATRVSAVAFTFDHSGGVALQYQAVAGEPGQSWCTFEDFVF